MTCAQEGTLKGMLHLYGCKCYAVKRKLEVRRARSFEFEVVASQSSGAAGTSTASVASTPRSLKRFFMSAAKSDANPFNPMNASKNTYHWFAATAEERERYCRAHLFLNCSIPLCASLESSAYHVYFGVALREAGSVRILITLLPADGWQRSTALLVCHSLKWKQCHGQASSQLPQVRLHMQQCYGTSCLCQGRAVLLTLCVPGDPVLLFTVANSMQ